MDYIQEAEEYSTQVLNEEETKQFSLLVSGFIVLTPNNKYLDSYRNELAAKIHNL